MPGGGIYDGTYGVLSGIECVQRLKELGYQNRHPIQVIAFTEEEGNVIGGTFGSKAFTGGEIDEAMRPNLALHGLTMEQEYFPGFGSRELRQFLIGGAASAVLGALALIVCIMTGASGSIMAVRKDPYTRISVVTQIGNMIKFRHTQQNFRYVYKSPWEQS